MYILGHESKERQRQRHNAFLVLIDFRDHISSVDDGFPLLWPKKEQSAWPHGFLGEQREQNSAKIFGLLCCEPHRQAPASFEKLSAQFASIF